MTDRPGAAPASAPNAAIRGPFAESPSRLVPSSDGTPIAVFEAGSDGPQPPLILVHGATADHTTFRAVAPLLGRTRRVLAIDRRGRGASGDGAMYAIELEFEDIAAVADDTAKRFGGPVDVLGHSYGGRCALGASLLTDAIRKVVAYEGAPVPADSSYRPDGLLEAVRGSLARGDPDAALSGFLAGVVGMSEAELARYRGEPVWPARVAAAHTILRELEAETSPPASIEALAAVRVPVLLILGGSSRSPFGVGTWAFAERLAHAEVVTIEGAAHAAHHTHVAEFVAAVEAFLDG
ncbi:MAG TPA: alpha/beta hydrolase [Candidatus Limnocylindrales bacterium]|nr:alpha/beta hydrolase [Candidatus Limnocylindrales bacterium]